jgi:hypothetical protein
MVNEKSTTSSILTLMSIKKNKLIDWLVFNANFSSISAISWCEQILFMNLDDKDKIFCYSQYFSSKYHLTVAQRCEFDSHTSHGEVNSIPHYLIKFVSDFRQVGGFLLVLWLPQPI